MSPLAEVITRALNIVHQASATSSSGVRSKTDSSSRRSSTPLDQPRFDATQPLLRCMVSYSPPEFQLSLREFWIYREAARISRQGQRCQSTAGTFNSTTREFSCYGSGWRRLGGLSLLGQPYQSHTLQVIAKASPAHSQVIFNRRIASDGVVGATCIDSRRQSQTDNSRPRRNRSNYHRCAPRRRPVRTPPTSAIVSPLGPTVYATYVPNQSFDFTRTNEPQSPAPASLGLLRKHRRTAPDRSTAGALGQLITLTGGGFGPSTPIYTTPDTDGNIL